MFFPLRDNAPRRRFPFVNWTLIALNTLVFLYELRLPRPFLEHVFFPAFGLVPFRYLLWLRGFHVGWAALVLPVFTSMFIHGGWLHLLGNMWVLYIFGDNVEDVFGHSGYLLFYLSCGVAAALTQVILNLPMNVPTVGASGAIAGVMGAYLVRFPRARVFTLVFLVIFVTFWEMPAWFFLGFWFLLQFLSGASTLAGSARMPMGGIAWFAHVGGFLTGILWMLLTAKPQPRRAYWA